MPFATIGELVVAAGLDALGAAAVDVDGDVERLVPGGADRDRLVGQADHDLGVFVGGRLLVLDVAADDFAARRHADDRERNADRLGGVFVAGRRRFVLCRCRIRSGRGPAGG